ncbi:basic proline-rich protein-like [Perognathus longimembris pacificus]|uniref:basic proline-rich protein-like n=1 Tax=Perognathus longimembris pacificus TaxID=214514 RepID=UPI00201A0BE8|nr:basic proline-rich protein-like [Perognathus longimembris pacificus]
MGPEGLAGEFRRGHRTRAGAGKASGPSGGRWVPEPRSPGFSPGTASSVGRPPPPICHLTLSPASVTASRQAPAQGGARAPCCLTEEHSPGVGQGRPADSPVGRPNPHGSRRAGQTRDGACVSEGRRRLLPMGPVHRHRRLSSPTGWVSAQRPQGPPGLRLYQGTRGARGPGQPSSGLNARPKLPRSKSGASETALGQAAPRSGVTADGWRWLGPVSDGFAARPIVCRKKSRQPGSHPGPCAAQSLLPAPRSPHPCAVPRTPPRSPHPCAVPAPLRGPRTPPRSPHPSAVPAPLRGPRTPAPSPHPSAVPAPLRGPRTPPRSPHPCAVPAPLRRPRTPPRSPHPSAVPAPLRGPRTPAPSPHPCAVAAPLRGPRTPAPSPHPCAVPAPLRGPRTPPPSPHPCAVPAPLRRPRTPAPSPHPSAVPAPLRRPRTPAPSPHPCAVPAPLRGPRTPAPSPHPSAVPAPLRGPRTPARSPHPSAVPAPLRRPRTPAPSPHPSAVPAPLRGPRTPPRSPHPCAVPAPLRGPRTPAPSPHPSAVPAPLRGPRTPPRSPHPCAVPAPLRGPRTPPRSPHPSAVPTPLRCPRTPPPDSGGAGSGHRKPRPEDTAVHTRTSVPGGTVRCSVHTCVRAWELRVLCAAAEAHTGDARRTAVFSGEAEGTRRLLWERMKTGRLWPVGSFRHPLCCGATWTDVNA